MATFKPIAINRNGVVLEYKEGQYIVATAPFSDGTKSYPVGVYVDMLGIRQQLTTRGPEGQEGRQGSVGPQGPQGPQGEQGIQGPQGLRGIQGEQGVQGPQGIRGEQGPAGKNGNSFKITNQADSVDDLPEPSSAYLDDAFYVGTESPRDIYACVEYNGELVWQNQGPLQGPKGDKGEQGIQGPQGLQGIKGETGPQGAVGPQGPQGEQGIQGSKGDTGDTGATGATPNVSMTASVDENVGTPSVTVIKSGTIDEPTFELLFQNLKGQKGDAGARGPQGVQGPQGDTGPAGSFSRTYFKWVSDSTGDISVSDLVFTVSNVYHHNITISWTEGGGALSGNIHFAFISNSSSKITSVSTLCTYLNSSACMATGYYNNYGIAYPVLTVSRFSTDTITVTYLQ